MASSANSFQPLNVSVVGAGIGGLTAAIALRRNGHMVHVFETTGVKTEIGAALGLQPNAMRVLDHLGVSRANLKGIQHAGHVIFDSKGGEESTYHWLGSTANEKSRLAIGEGEGPPVKLHLGSEVVACNTEEGTIVLNGGEIVPADIVLGADGINSVIRTEILGSIEKAPASGWSCFRTVFESQATEIPELEWLTTGVSGTRSVVMKDGPMRMIFSYPCRNGTLINFVGFFTDSPEDKAASREEIMEKFQDFHPKFLRVLDLPSHSAIQKWKLRVLPLLPTWIRGRAALLGDAAHATVPFLGQGAGMAIEDAGALGCFFPPGTRREDIPSRLEAYQDIRKPRGEFVKTESVEQVSLFATGSENMWFRSQEIQTHLRNYDAIKVAQECYEERFGPGFLPK
ncbi:FAD/NAD(P)-binding domain-containing protein [Mycena vulgaris]|nr:FAD/NAD(P)-binding domain-containing protein [Mycena vulgaris]